MKVSKADRTKALENLAELLKPGDTVYTCVRHVARSGMSRDIDLYVMRDNEPRWISYWVSQALGYPLAKHDRGIKIGGCGMDMGFHLVYNLGRRLWPNGTPKPHGRRNGEPDSDGGFALTHRWL